MTNITVQQIETACKEVLGKDTVDRMKAVRYSWPSLVNFAAIECFRQQRNDECAVLLRMALTHYDKGGVIE